MGRYRKDVAGQVVIAAVIVVGLLGSLALAAGLMLAAWMVSL
jgi:hypothetical protein